MYDEQPAAAAAASFVMYTYLFHIFLFANVISILRSRIKLRTKADRARMARYDEDLHENEFFRTLVSRHTAMFNEAAEQKLLVSVRLVPQCNYIDIDWHCTYTLVKICVPRSDTVSRLKLSQSDFENHILRPNADNKYTSLNEKVGF